MPQPSSRMMSPHSTSAAASQIWSSVSGTQEQVYWPACGQIGAGSGRVRRRIAGTCRGEGAGVTRAGGRGPRHRAWQAGIPAPWLQQPLTVAAGSLGAGGGAGIAAGLARAGGGGLQQAAGGGRGEGAGLSQAGAQQRHQQEVASHVTCVHNLQAGVCSVASGRAHGRQDRLGTPTPSW